MYCSALSTDRSTCWVTARGMWSPQHFLIHQSTVLHLPRTDLKAGCRPQRCCHLHTSALPGTPVHWTAALLCCNTPTQMQHTHMYVSDNCQTHCCSEKPVATDEERQQGKVSRYCVMSTLQYYPLTCLKYNDRGHGQASPSVKTVCVCVCTCLSVFQCL